MWHSSLLVLYRVAPASDLNTFFEQLKLLYLAEDLLGEEEVEELLQLEVEDLKIRGSELKLTRTARSGLSAHDWPFRQYCFTHSGLPVKVMKRSGEPIILNIVTAFSNVALMYLQGI